ncbi:MAG TPA: hypothetical protein VF584_19935 [Longimicrobium sp.]
MPGQLIPSGTCSGASLIPGRTTRPPSAMRRVARPASRSTCSLVPTATMRSPRMASA